MAASPRAQAPCAPTFCTISPCNDGNSALPIEIVFDRGFLLSVARPIVVHVFDRTPVRTIE
jgi:hypothetical protein